MEGNNNRCYRNRNKSQPSFGVKLRSAVVLEETKTSGLWGEMKNSYLPSKIKECCLGINKNIRYLERRKNRRCLGRNKT